MRIIFVTKKRVEMTIKMNSFLRRTEKKEKKRKSSPGSQLSTGYDLRQNQSLDMVYNEETDRSRKYYAHTLLLSDKICSDKILFVRAS